MWTIECYGSGCVVISRNDARHGETRHVRWWNNCPVTTKWISLDSMNRIVDLAQRKAENIDLERDGWTAIGPDGVL